MACRWPARCGTIGRMKRLLALLCALLPCACHPGSAVPLEPGQHIVERVIVVKDSGPVLPHWSEHYDISMAGIQFRRTGEPASTINTGEWEIEPDAAALALLCCLGL